MATALWCQPWVRRAVSGWVRRPGIYELGPGQSSISLAELLELGGGLQVRGTFRYALQTTDPDGRLNLKSLASLSGHAQDGDILFVEQAVSAQAGRFEFFGPTSLAGDYSLSNYRNLSIFCVRPVRWDSRPTCYWA